MVTHFASVGGWELVLVVGFPVIMLAAILFTVYFIVRLATRSRSRPSEDERS